MKRLLLAIAILAVAAFPAFAGEWHSGTSNVCTDCHTMHFSQSHSWGDAVTVTTTPKPNGDWLGTPGPNDFLLKAPANQLCLACHDGQAFAPDVFQANINASPTQGRSAGAVTDEATPGTYIGGHPLGSAMAPPGYNPAAVGAPAAWYTGTTDGKGLECISCHAQHGPTTAYRNLGPYSLGATASNFRPTYVIGTTNTATQDVWINIASPYTPNTGLAATFDPYYDTANVSFNRNDAVVSGITTSNRVDTFCATCHGNFHGGTDSPTVKGSATAAALDGFARHPTSQVVIGASGAQGYGGHSALTRFTANTTKVRVYASDRVGYTDATPGCVSCHKAHGNQNPFGLVFLNRNATSVGEEGGYAAGQVAYAGTSASAKDGYRNLCGQCHGQGN